MDYLADFTEEEFKEWLRAISSLVGAAQTRVYKYLRNQALEQRRVKFDFLETTG